MLSRSAVFSWPLTRTFTRTAQQLPSKAYTDVLRSDYFAVNSTPPDLKPSERNILDSALRIDQAGEIAANHIYRGQMAVLGHDRKLGTILQVL